MPRPANGELWLLLPFPLPAILDLGYLSYLCAYLIGPPRHAQRPRPPKQFPLGQESEKPFNRSRVPRPRQRSLLLLLALLLILTTSYMR